MMITFTFTLPPFLFAHSLTFCRFAVSYNSLSPSRLDPSSFSTLVSPIPQSSENTIHSMFPSKQLPSTCCRERRRSRIPFTSLSAPTNPSNDTFFLEPTDRRCNGSTLNDEERSESRFVKLMNPPRSSSLAIDRVDS